MGNWDPSFKVIYVYCTLGLTTSYLFSGLNLMIVAKTDFPSHEKKVFPLKEMTLRKPLVEDAFDFVFEIIT